MENTSRTPRLSQSPQSGIEWAFCRVIGNDPNTPRAQGLILRQREIQIYIGKGEGSRCLFLVQLSFPRLWEMLNDPECGFTSLARARDFLTLINIGVLYPLLSNSPGSLLIIEARYSPFSMGDLCTLTTLAWHGFLKSSTLNIMNSGNLTPALECDLSYHSNRLQRLIL